MIVVLNPRNARSMAFWPTDRNTSSCSQASSTPLKSKDSFASNALIRLFSTCSRRLDPLLSGRTLTTTFGRHKARSSAMVTNDTYNRPHARTYNEVQQTYCSQRTKSSIDHPADRLVHTPRSANLVSQLGVDACNDVVKRAVLSEAWRCRDEISWKICSEHELCCCTVFYVCVTFVFYQ